MVLRIVQSIAFERWLIRLRDKRAIARIKLRLSAVSDGNFGDMRSVGNGVLELRIHSGPGYRLYLVREGDEVVVLLYGGDKSSQQRDIKRAHELAREWR